MAKYKLKKQNKISPKLLIAFGVAVLVAGGNVIYRYSSPNSSVTDDHKEIIVDMSNESNEESLSETPREVTTSPSRDGGAVDTGGSDAKQEGESTSSSSRRITVYSPSPSQVITNGSTISGASSLSVVSYRLIDDQIGVIGTGTLSVVNGKFSGKFSFSSNGTEGRLDVFRSLDDGREVDIVEVPVRFK